MTETTMPPTDVDADVDAADEPPTPVAGPGPRPGRLARAEHRLGDLDRRFYGGLVVIALGGLALRLAVILSRPTCAVGTADTSSCFSGTNDARFYFDQANLFANHVWFRSSNGFDAPELAGATHPSAYHPPLYSLYLGVVSW